MTAFPEGRRNADQQFHAFQRLLLSNPFIGEAVADIPEARAFPIQKTPFTVI